MSDSIDLLLQWIDKKFDTSKLIRRKIRVHREGKDFERWQWVKPEELENIKISDEEKSDYTLFLNASYRELSSAHPKQKIISLVKKLFESQDKLRDKFIGKADNSRLFQLIDSWIGGMLPNLIGYRMIWGKIIGKEITEEDVIKYVESVFGEKKDKKFIDTLIGISKVITAEADMKTGTLSTQRIENLMKVEHEFSKRMTKALFGNTLKVYRGVYGKAAQDILNQTKQGKTEEIDEFSLTSYTQDLLTAAAFLYNKQKPHIVIERNISSEEVFSAWFSNPILIDNMPEQREIIVTSKSKFILTKEAVREIS